MTSYLTMNLTSKLDNNDNENQINDINIDNEIENYISKNGFVRRIQLVKDLMNNHHNERGYSRRTIDRKIDKMIELEIILKIESDQELKKYGIQKKDGRAKYLTLKRSTEIKEHLDKVFELFISGDETDQKIALREIENYQENYVLDGLQLVSLVQKLNSENDELINRLLRILNDHITKKQIKPSDEDQFRTALKSLLKRCPKFDKSFPNLRYRIISLLGFYNDDTIVEQLIVDANGNEDDFNLVQNAYWDKFCANVIENHREELFELERKFEREGKEELSRLISPIRYQARLNLGMITPKKEETEEW